MRDTSDYYYYIIYMMYICKKDGLKRDIHIYMPKLFIDGETVEGDRD